MLASGQLEKKVSQGSWGLRVEQAALASLVLATRELLAFRESLGIPAYRGYLGNQVYLDRKVSATVMELEMPKKERKVVCVCLVLYVGLLEIRSNPDCKSHPITGHPSCSVVTIATIHPAIPS